MRLTISAIFCCVALSGACAQQAARPAPAPAHAGAYVPDLADMMTTTQFRHLKLSYAGSLKNWDLALFEAARIRDSFDVVSKYYPRYGNVSIPKMIDEFTKPALDRVNEAIEAKDSAKFYKAFGDLTKACNACHKAVGLQFIRIRAPTSSPFSNQVFAPKGP